MKKFGLDFKDGVIEGFYDGNADGDKSVKLNINIKEVYGELFSKGEAKVDVKSFSIKKEGAKIILVLDTDKDDQPVLELELDFIEGLQEAF